MPRMSTNVLCVAWLVAGTLLGSVAADCDVSALGDCTFPSSADGPMYCNELGVLNSCAAAADCTSNSAVIDAQRGYCFVGNQGRVNIDDDGNLRIASKEVCFLVDGGKQLCIGELLADAGVSKPDWITASEGLALAVQEGASVLAQAKNYTDKAEARANAHADMAAGAAQTQAVAHANSNHGTVMARIDNVDQTVAGIGDLLTTLDGSHNTSKDSLAVVEGQIVGLRTDTDANAADIITNADEIETLKTVTIPAASASCESCEDHFRALAACTVQGKVYDVDTGTCGAQFACGENEVLVPNALPDEPSCACKIGYKRNADTELCEEFTYTDFQGIIDTYYYAQYFYTSSSLSVYGTGLTVNDVPWAVFDSECHENGGLIHGPDTGDNTDTSAEYLWIEFVTKQPVTFAEFQVEGRDHSAQYFGNGRVRALKKGQWVDLASVHGEPGTCSWGPVVASSSSEKFNVFRFEIWGATRGAYQAFGALRIGIAPEPYRAYQYPTFQSALKEATYAQSFIDGNGFALQPLAPHVFDDECQGGQIVHGVDHKAAFGDNWIKFEMHVPLEIEAFVIKGRNHPNAAYIGTVQLFGSADGSSWTAVTDSTRVEPGRCHVSAPIKATTSTAFKWFKFEMWNNNAGGYHAFAQLKIFSVPA